MENDVDGEGDLLIWSLHSKCRPSGRMEITQLVLTTWIVQLVALPVKLVTVPASTPFRKSA